MPIQWENEEEEEEFIDEEVFEVVEMKFDRYCYFCGEMIHTVQRKKYSNRYEYIFDCPQHYDTTQITHFMGDGFNLLRLHAAEKEHVGKSFVDINTIEYRMERFLDLFTRMARALPEEEKKKFGEELESLLGEWKEPELEVYREIDLS
jgi:hypothetical protein